MVIYLKSAKQGQTAYHLTIKVIIGKFNTNRTMNIDFTGTELTAPDIPFTDSQKEDFKVKLKERFGMAPFTGFTKRETKFNDSECIEIKDK